VASPKAKWRLTEQFLTGQQSSYRSQRNGTYSGFLTPTWLPVLVNIQQVGDGVVAATGAIGAGYRRRILRIEGSRTEEEKQPWPWCGSCGDRHQLVGVGGEGDLNRKQRVLILEHATRQRCGIH